MDESGCVLSLEERQMVDSDANEDDDLKYNSEMTMIEIDTGTGAGKNNQVIGLRNKCGVIALTKLSIGDFRRTSVFERVMRLLYRTRYVG